MSKFRDETASVLDAVFCKRTVSDKDQQYLLLLAQEAKKLSSDETLALTDYFLTRNFPADNSLGLYFALFDIFQDLRFIDRAVEYLPPKLTLPILNEFHWNVAQRKFGNAGVKGSFQLIDTLMRKALADLGRTTRQFLSSRNVIQRKQLNKKPKNIAIISPQILGMRHSPSREAFNMALCLTTFHSCNVYIFNTNSMNYPGQNHLGLANYAQFNHSQQLNGLQNVPVQYMAFDSQVQIASFAPGEMNTQKVASIAATMKSLDIDAVISHGENFVIMESLYSLLPSLFATTGGVVPYSHCDAYFVPANLFNENTQALADEYGHSNFMLESMLVTPEGVAEAPHLPGTYGLTESRFHYLVVGTRLEREISTDFVDACISILAAHDQACILFAGSADLKLETWFDVSLIESKRIVNVGFQQDLPGLCKMADCYLNPDREGGGTSSQTAIINGLPVVTLNKGHISAVVPERLRQASWDAYVKYAVNVAIDQDYRNNEVAALQQHFYAELDSHGQIARMYDKLCEVAHSYN